MNDYEAKQEARRQRYAERAETLAKDAERTAERLHKHLDAIPFGQPILIGHHSEKRHRAHIRKSERMMRKVSETSDKADYYRSKAASVGTGGISSDDPDAIEKLREKLARLEKEQELMKAANKIIKGKKASDAEKVAALVGLGISEKHAAQLLQPNHVGRVGFAGFELSNNNANIRRIRDRIAHLERTTALPDVEQAHETAGVTLRETDNRTQLVFPGKPSAEVRAMLKRHGFRWAPSEGAWQRHRSNAAKWAAQDIIRQLEEAKTA